MPPDFQLNHFAPGAAKVGAEFLYVINDLLFTGRNEFRPTTLLYILCGSSCLLCVSLRHCPLEVPQRTAKADAEFHKAINNRLFTGRNEFRPTTLLYILCGSSYLLCVSLRHCPLEVPQRTAKVDAEFRKVFNGQLFTGRNKFRPTTLLYILCGSLCLLCVSLRHCLLEVPQRTAKVDAEFRKAINNQLFTGRNEFRPTTILYILCGSLCLLCVSLRHCLLEVPQRTAKVDAEFRKAINNQLFTGRNEFRPTTILYILCGSPRLLCVTLRHFSC